MDIYDNMISATFEQWPILGRPSQLIVRVVVMSAMYKVLMGLHIILPYMANVTVTK